MKSTVFMIQVLTADEICKPAIALVGEAEERDRRINMGKNRNGIWKAINNHRS
ncbi:MAG TPA: hypothetical protein V6C63_06020 [Allocoleopsis sp.]